MIIIWSMILEEVPKVSAETFNDTYHIALAIILAVISYFLKRLFKEFDDLKAENNRQGDKVTEACNDIRWIKRGLRRTGYRAEQYADVGDDDEHEN